MKLPLTAATATFWQTANKKLPTAHGQLQTDCHDVGFIAMAGYLIGTISYEF